MGTEFWKLSAVELAEGIRRRDFSSVEVVTSVLGRVRADNPRLNAITVDCSADALEDAERADAAVRRGDALGELHGVPVTIKENADQRGKQRRTGYPRSRT
jgi:amidase